MRRRKGINDTFDRDMHVHETGGMFEGLTDVGDMDRGQGSGSGSGSGSGQ